MWIATIISSLAHPKHIPQVQPCKGNLVEQNIKMVKPLNSRFFSDINSRITITATLLHYQKA